MVLWSRFDNDIRPADLMSESTSPPQERRFSTIATIVISNHDELLLATIDPHGTYPCLLLLSIVSQKAITHLTSQTVNPTSLPSSPLLIERLSELSQQDLRLSVPRGPQVSLTIISSHDLLHTDLENYLETETG